jgi:chemotaxis family two-component system response regulator Rcp1
MSMLQILLAEDNPGDVWLVEQALETHKVVHQLHVVQDGDEALAFIDAQSPCPDLLLLDLNLPKIDGSEILNVFRQHPKCAHTPVIVISSSDTHRDRARTAELGIACYFRKPLEFAAFMRLGQIVREVVEQEQSRPI